MSDPLKVRQHQEILRVKELSHLFDPDPENPMRLSKEAEKRPLPEGLTFRHGAAAELEKFLQSDFPEVRRLAASALGKMANDGMQDTGFVFSLAKLAENDPHPQVRQYAVKAMGRYIRSARLHLDLLKDVARDETAPSYLRTAAAEVVAAIQTEVRERFSRMHHWCTRCKRIISEEEFMAGIERWGKPYCRHCLDEREMENVNFESVVEVAKQRRSTGGTAVQSRGEKRIAEFLEKEGIEYVYDERYRISGDALVRPDFYLPEFDLYIEYWGMDTPEYVANMRKKKELYQRAGKKLVSISWQDDENLVETLRTKLSRYFRI